MKFKDCAECGGQCCMGFGVPVEYELALRTIGVPLALYRSNLDLYPRRYFELHTGVTISEDGKRFIVAEKVPVRRVETPTWDYLFVDSRCTMLNDKGHCMIYDTRPDMCKSFTAETKKSYYVPMGCKYEFV
jgi:Fe-S-cluster containining protein